MQIPLFPLSSVVMPGGLMPLRIFERRYMDMVRDSLKLESGFGICLVKEGSEVGARCNAVSIRHTGEHRRLGSGRKRAVAYCCRGEDKFRILDTEVDQSELLHGTVEILPAEPSMPVPAEYQYLVKALEQILEQVSTSVQYKKHHMDDALWLGSRFVELLPMSAELRHELLSMDQPIDRLAALAEIFSTIAKRTSKEF